MGRRVEHNRRISNDRVRKVRKQKSKILIAAEVFGIKQATADAEVILMAVNYLKSLGLQDLSVEINSLGCPQCREVFKTKLKEVLKPYLSELCPDCQARYEKNPLRLLDCKVEDCKKIYEKSEVQAIIQSDFICEDCAEHFHELQKYLNELNINYSINKLLVRGLDYYNRTVFEIKSNNLGSQNAVCGGGRYDSLVKNLGGEDTPAVGFAMGMERLAALIGEKQECKILGFVVSSNSLAALKLAEELRQKGITVEFDLANKKFVKQLEKAAKVAKYALILGEDEISTKQITVKNLETSEQVTVARSEILNYLK